MKLPEELTEQDICPKCGGPLDTGWECLRCGFDAMVYVVPVERLRSGKDNK